MAFWRSEPTVRLVSLAIFSTGVRAFVCARRYLIYAFEKRRAAILMGIFADLGAVFFAVFFFAVFAALVFRATVLALRATDFSVSRQAYRERSGSDIATRRKAGSSGAYQIQDLHQRRLLARGSHQSSFANKPTPWDANAENEPLAHIAATATHTISKIQRLEVT
jgi:hypothetical protein